MVLQVERDEEWSGEGAVLWRELEGRKEEEKEEKERGVRQD